MPFRRLMDSVPISWIRAIRSALIRQNRFVRTLIRFSNRSDSAPSARIEISEDGAAPEVAALIRYNNSSTSEIQPRTIVIQRYGENTLQYISVLSRLWEPLCYPLLFPNGQTGWFPGCGQCFFIRLLYNLSLIIHGHGRSYLNVACQTTYTARTSFQNIWKAGERVSRGHVVSKYGDPFELSSEERQSHCQRRR